MENAYEDGPSFNWPQKQSEQLHAYDHPDDVKPEDVVTTVKNLINTFLTNNTEETNLTSVPEVNVDEMISDNNTMITVQVQETTNSSILTEMFQSNQTLLNTNNTILTEMTESNNTVLTATGDGDVSLGSTIATQTMNTVETTTEKIATTISNFFTSTNNYDEDGDITTYDKHGSESEDMTLYIVLGVILGCLLLVLIILIIIYRRYKAINNSRSGVYCVTNLHEVSTSSGTHKETVHC